MPSKRDALAQIQKNKADGKSHPDHPIDHKKKEEPQFVSIEVLKSPAQKSVSNAQSRISKQLPSISREGSHHDHNHAPQVSQNTTADTETSPSHPSKRKTLVVEDRSRSIHHYRQVQLNQTGPGKAQTTVNPIPEPQSFIRTTGSCQRAWTLFSIVVTFWAPDFILRRCLNKKDKQSQDAWREKMALCAVSFLLCVFLGFFTFFFQTTACPPPPKDLYSLSQVEKSDIITPGKAKIFGQIYDIKTWITANHPRVPGLDWDAAFKAIGTKDLSGLFKRGTPSCEALGIKLDKSRCTSDPYGFKTAAHCHDWNSVKTALDSAGLKRGFSFLEWSDVMGQETRVAFKGEGIDLTAFLGSQNSIFTPEQRQKVSELIGKDGTLAFAKTENDQFLGQCLLELYGIGPIDYVTIECLAANTLLNIALIIICSVVLIRFILAVFFSWFLSWQLGKIQQTRSIFNMGAAAPTEKVSAITHPQSFSLFTTVDFKHVYKELYTICLVTCYSEGEEGLRTTLDSIASTDYNPNYKLIFVVADGVVKGAGNDKPTGDIVLDMMEIDQSMHGKPISYDNSEDPSHPSLLCGNAEANTYEAIGQGPKRLNKARVYCGYYRYKESRVAMILVYKTGMQSEKSAAKPGNRGKRDSQIVLMDFLSKVMFDERLSAFQFDLFTKWTHIMTVQNGGSVKVTPDDFEVILMVDADTRVMPDSLTRMVAVLQRDPSVMGLCGETRILNKNESWVTMIQVFEYYVSHHLAKAFESIFGGVTCLPGCFSIYRIKAPKPLESSMRNMQNPEANCQWVPILANPDIVRDYSQTQVDTLHKKNLLLLGEDRYLTTLMLSTFPRRKMMFVPKAICKTQVPAEFSVLLSQRRRWINSTIHNLMELVLIKELCGIFCFSMQFVVFLELVGTATLPAAIAFTLVLIVSAIIGPVVPWVPLGLLFAILGLPAFLIIFTTRKAAYLFYMGCYLLALPIWNFVLPVYSFWHFDDFSWGQTRQVQGEKKDTGHGGEEHGDLEEDLPLKRWSEWEKIRRKALKLAHVNDPVGIVLHPHVHTPQEVKRKKGFFKTVFGIKSSNSIKGPQSPSSPLPKSLDTNLASNPAMTNGSLNAELPAAPSSARLQSRPNTARAKFAFTNSFQAISPYNDDDEKDVNN